MITVAGYFDYLWNRDTRFQSEKEKRLKEYLSHIHKYHLILETGENDVLTKKQYDLIILNELEELTELMSSKIRKAKIVEEGLKLLE